MSNIDLHTHSTFSDGTTTPTNLIREAAEAGLMAIALTDHDTMAGVAEAIEAGDKAGIEVIPGVELSASHDGTAVHILGYGLDRLNPGVVTLLADLQIIRQHRNNQIIANLAELGITIDRDELLASSSGLIGRPHIARLLVKQQVVHSINQAFLKYLRKDGLAYASAKHFPATEAIRKIKQAGGLAVLAHPTTITRSLGKITGIVKYLAEHELDGIEAIYPGHTIKTSKGLCDLATDLDLIVTGGSDFHGAVKQGINIGGAPVMPPVPYHLLVSLKQRLAANNQRQIAPWD